MDESKPLPISGTAIVEVAEERMDVRNPRGLWGFQWRAAVRSAARLQNARPYNMVSSVSAWEWSGCAPAQSLGRWAGAWAAEGGIRRGYERLLFTYPLKGPKRGDRLYRRVAETATRVAALRRDGLVATNYQSCTVRPCATIDPCSHEDESGVDSASRHVGLSYYTGAPGKVEIKR